jgi:hypothetical protein
MLLMSYSDHCPRYISIGQPLQIVEKVEYKCLDYKTVCKLPLIMVDFRVFGFHVLWTDSLLYWKLLDDR